MNKFIASIAGILLIGAVGAGTAQAQGVHVRIDKPGKSVEIKTGGHANQGGEYITVKKKVWHEGHYDIVCENVWIPASCKIVEECIWVPASCKIVSERVYVPAKTVTVKERRVDHCGVVFYVNVCKVIPAHYETVNREVHVPGYHKTIQKEVHVPGHYEKVERKVFVPGHYDIVEERVLVNNGGGHNHRETVAAPRGRSTR